METNDAIKPGEAFVLDTEALASPVDSSKDEKVPNPLFEELAPEHWVENLPGSVIELPNYSYLSKFQFIDGPPQQQPFYCAGCRGYDGLFLDINLEIDFFGKFYWCTNCIREIAQQIGYAPRELWSKLQRDIESKQEELDRVKEENNELRTALGSLGRISFSNDSVSVIDPVPVEEPDEEPRNGDEVIGGSTAGEEGDAKPDHVKGRTDFSADASSIAELLDNL
jgi:hypothetical protein